MLKRPNVVKPDEVRAVHLIRLGAVCQFGCQGAETINKSRALGLVLGSFSFSVKCHPVDKNRIELNWKRWNRSHVFKRGVQVILHVVEIITQRWAGNLSECHRPR